MLEQITHDGVSCSSCTIHHSEVWDMDQQNFDWLQVHMKSPNTAGDCDIHQWCLESPPQWSGRAVQNRFEDNLLGHRHVYCTILLHHTMCSVWRTSLRSENRIENWTRMRCRSIYHPVPQAAINKIDLKISKEQGTSVYWVWNANWRILLRPCAFFSMFLVTFFTPNLCGRAEKNKMSKEKNVLAQCSSPPNRQTTHQTHCVERGHSSSSSFFFFSFFISKRW